MLERSCIVNIILWRGCAATAAQPVVSVLNPHRENFSRFRINALSGLVVDFPGTENQPMTGARQITAVGHKMSFHFELYA